MDEKFLSKLIEEITPLNNLYRLAVKNREPAHLAIGYLWDIGDILVKNGVQRIHPLAREIQERSYITANLLSYAFRVRRYFDDRKTIRRRFGKVPYYSIFREAFPLLENRRYRLTKKEERELLRLMNSGMQPKELRRRIAVLKQGKNPGKKRCERIFEELQSFADLFRNSLREMERLMENGSRRELYRFRESFTPEFLLFWNRLAIALADETFSLPPPPVPLNGAEEEWAGLVQAMHDIAWRGRPTRNRARRLIGSMEFLKMAGYVDVLRDGKKLDEYIKKRRAGKTMEGRRAPSEY